MKISQHFKGLAIFINIFLAGASFVVATKGFYGWVILAWAGVGLNTWIFETIEKI